MSKELSAPTDQSTDDQQNSVTRQNSAIEEKNILQSSLEKMTLALEYGGIGLWETDIEAQTITLSEIILRQLQYPVENLTRSFGEWQKLFPENDWIIAWDAINDCILNHSDEFLVDYRMRAADGSYRWYQARGMLVRDEKNRVLKVLGASSDITQQKTSEQKLLRIYEHSRKERDKTRLAKKMARVGMWEIDLYGERITVDANYAEMIGYPSVEKTLSYSQWRKHMPDGEFEKITDEVNRCLRGEIPEYEVAYKKFHRDGTLRHYLCRGVAIKGSDGRHIGALGASIDVTESEARYAELAEKESFYRKFVEHLPAGAVLVRGEKMIVNQAVEKMTGYDRSELGCVMDWFRLLHPGKAYEMRRYYEVEREAHPARRGVVAIINREGKTRQLRFAAYAQGEIDIWVLRDETQSNRNERIMRQNEQISGSGGWELDCATGDLYWTEGMYRLHETTPHETKITHEKAIAFFVPEFREMVRKAVEEARVHGKAWDFKAEKITARGNRFWIRTIGIPEYEGGYVVRIYGSVIDVTSQQQTSCGVATQPHLRLAGGKDADKPNDRRQ